MFICKTIIYAMALAFASTCNAEQSDVVKKIINENLNVLKEDLNDMAINKFLDGPALQVNQRILQLATQAPHKAALRIDIPLILNLDQTKLNDLSVLDIATVSNNNFQVKMRTKISTMPIVKAMVTCKYDARYNTLLEALTYLGISQSRGRRFLFPKPNIGDKIEEIMRGYKEDRLQLSLTGGITANTDSLTLDVSVKDGNIIINKASVDQFAINMPEFDFSFDDITTEISYNLVTHPFRQLEKEMYQKYRGQLQTMLASKLKDM
eukprot:Pgem_evm1s9619